MKPYVDHVLCILPFEPAELQRLGGPPGTFVGHRLTGDAGVLAAAAAQAMPRDLSPDREKTLLLLPGSRRGEVSRLIGPFGETAAILERADTGFGSFCRPSRMLPIWCGLPSRGWEQKPEIVTDAAGKWQAFGEADAALAASGTVSLELALAGVPLVSCYKLDPFARAIQKFITIWSASLPNLIADRTIVTEVYNQYVWPQWLARHMEGLFCDTSLRRWQKDGFLEVSRRMATDRPSGEIAAGVVMREIEGNRGIGE